MIKSAPSTSLPREKPLILIVEDDSTVRRMFQKELEGEGYRVVTASNGRKAWHIARNESPRAAIVDILLPGEIQGLTLCRRFKEDLRTSGIHVLLITGEYLKDEDRIKGLEAGAVGYFRKPVAIPELLTKLRPLIPVTAGIEGLSVGTIDLRRESVGISALHKARVVSPPAKILVIEDDEEMQKLIRSVLEYKGFETTFAFSGRDGLLKAQALCPDLVILDLSLPGLNGVEIYKLLGAGEKTKNIPVLVMTAMADSSDVLRSAVTALGINDFLRKPFGANELLQHVRRLLADQVHASFQAGDLPTHALEARNSGIIERGPIRIDATIRKVWVKGRLIENMGPKRFDLLCMLLNHKGPVSREILRKRVWGNGDDLKTVDRTINRLRENLGFIQEEIIVSVPGGYMLAG